MDPIQTVSNVLRDVFSNHKKIKNIIKQFDSHKNQIAMDLSFNKEYKIITLGKGNKTYLGIILDKSKQQILEMNIPEEPVKYKLISEKDAIKTLVKNNILRNNEAKSVDSRLVYLKNYTINRFYPLWELKKDSAIYYVNQDSKIINVNLSKKNESALVDKSMPKVFELRQNYPNPFNPSTTINYQLPNAGVVTLIIYDVLGKEVKTLVNDFKSKGRYSVNFNAGNLASGVYIYRLKVNDFSSVKKLLLLK